MSPLKVLGRGYAMARNEGGRVLKSSGEVAIGRPGPCDPVAAAGLPLWWMKLRRNNMAAKKLSFEEKLSRLEEIVAALEKGDAPLADSLTLI